MSQSQNDNASLKLRATLVKPQELEVRSLYRLLYPQDQKLALSLRSDNVSHGFEAIYVI